LPHTRTLPHAPRCTHAAHTCCVADVYAAFTRGRTFSSCILWCGCSYRIDRASISFRQKRKAARLPTAHFIVMRLLADCGIASTKWWVLRVFVAECVPSSNGCKPRFHPTRGTRGVRKTLAWRRPRISSPLRPRTSGLRHGCGGIAGVDMISLVGLRTRLHLLYHLVRRARLTPQKATPRAIKSCAPRERHFILQPVYAFCAVAFSAARSLPRFRRLCLYWRWVEDSGSVVDGL